MYEKHKYNGKDLQELEKAFKKIANANPLKRYVYKYNLQNELVALNAECKLVNAMYKLNDFRASCYAYSFTTKKINEIVEYCYQHMTEKDVMKWCNEKSDFANVMNQDGSKKQYINLAYVYEYLYNTQTAIAARYFIESNIEYLEKEKADKDYPARKHILESAVWWANQGLLGRFGLQMPFTPKEYQMIPQLVIFSTFPSSGKSYLMNTLNEMFAELNWIMRQMGGVLRVGNEQTNIFRQSRQTMAMIENKLIFDVYPENKSLIFNGKYKPFEKSSEEEWSINGVQFDPATNIFKTRDSAINSVRCLMAVMDDPSRGQQESTNVKIHNDIVQLFYGDFSDRFKNQDDKLIFLTGTMFNPNDVFAVNIEKHMKGAVPDTRFKNTYVNYDTKTVIIVNDCEDENGESAFPEFISTQALMDKKEALDPYDYACVWRQKPIPAEGLIFDYDFLMQYDEINQEKLDDYSFAYIDPTRRSAKDFFSMPICRYCSEEDVYYLTDCIFEQKSSIDLVDKVVEKIINNKIIKIVIEENVDSSLALLLKERLAKNNIKWCEVVTKYNTVNKAMRIASMANSIKCNIKVPKKGLFGARHPLSQLMKQFTEYSAIDNNIHDDAPDSVAGFTDTIIINGNLKNKISSYKKLPF